MTSTDNTEVKSVVGNEAVEAPRKAVVESTVRTYSKPFDITAKDNAEIAAKKLFDDARRAEMEIAERKNIDANVTL
jgi:hypothetical protein